MRLGKRQLIAAMGVVYLGWRHSPQGVLGLFPDWFAPPQTDWPWDATADHALLTISLIMPRASSA
jgi:hypothetical protein